MILCSASTNPENSDYELVVTFVTEKSPASGEINPEIKYYFILFHIIIEIFRLEGTSGQYPAQSRTTHKFRLLEGFSTQASMKGDFIVSLDLTILQVKFSILLSIQILPLSLQ